MGHPFLLVGSTIGLAWLFASSGKQGAQGAPGLTPYSPSDPNAGLPQLASGQTPTTPWGGLGGPTSVPAADPVPGSDVQSGDNPFGVNSPSGVSIPESGNTPQFTPTFANDSSGDDAGTSVPAAFPSSGDDDSGGGVTLPAAGAVSGFMVGGPVGAVVGAMVGALVGAAAPVTSSITLEEYNHQRGHLGYACKTPAGTYGLKTGKPIGSQCHVMLTPSTGIWGTVIGGHAPPVGATLPERRFGGGAVQKGKLSTSRVAGTPSGLVYSRHARGWTHPYPGHAEGAPPPAGLPVY